jgi:uncharacterized protein YndB with AHSA1/START domain
MAATGDYTKQIHINAIPEKVFDTLTATAQFGAWWAPATGSAAQDGELQLTFDGIDDPLTMRVRQATRPSTVIWDVEACTFLPDWVGSAPTFTLSPSSSGGCDVRFEHEGLNPQLECYEMCRTGWDQYLPSLRDYVEAGSGNPYSTARIG